VVARNALWLRNLTDDAIRFKILDKEKLNVNFGKTNP